MQTILFIDGRNFISKIEAIKKDVDLSIYNFEGLLNKVLSGIKVDRKIFYIGRIINHNETKDKSAELIQKQRLLKTNLEKQGFEVIYAGHVRGNEASCPKGHKFLLFREKGVDVRIAVDMISFACDQTINTVIIASSDSDLQPIAQFLSEIPRYWNSCQKR